VTYSIEFSKAAAKKFRALPFQNQEQIKIKIDSLSIDPRPSGVGKLTGEDDLYRIRVGDYRIIYMIEDKKLLVLIVKIGHRREVYR
jgi:mRNA interferase RelE/StbE